MDEQIKRLKESINLVNDEIKDYEGRIRGLIADRNGMVNELNRLEIIECQ